VLPPEVETVAFSMKPGEVRGPVYSDQGAHVLELVERRASAARPFDEIKEDLRRQIAQDEFERSSRAWLEEVRRKAYVDVRL
jgi:parvulin-like peptidyl-prolyl isomerase